MKYECEGQISLFDVKGMKLEPKESPILLNTGQTLYVVRKGDVRKANVLDESWSCGEDDRGYRIEFANGGYDCVWNHSIGNDAFITYEPAYQQAEIYLNTHEVIRKENIHPVRTVAYQYIRDIDKRTMTAFYCELDNGMTYIKEFMTFHHMVRADKKEKAIKRFMAQQEFKYDDVEQVEYEPVFKNMYRIRQKYDWDYAEAGHGYAIG